MTGAPETLPRVTLERKLRSARRWNVALAVAAVVGLAFGGITLATSGGSAAPVAVGAGASQQQGSGSASGSDTAGANADQSKALERRVEGDPYAIGDVDAPLVLIEWVDMRCPYCAVFSRDTFPELVKDYVDTGKLRIEMHDVAFFEEPSIRASSAARAAANQGKYFEFLHEVYAAAPESGHPDLTEAELIAHAKAVGVADIEAFTSDMNSDAVRQQVQQDTAAAQRIGVSSVPFFLVDGQAFAGAQPADTFRSVLDEALAKHESAN